MEQRIPYTLCGSEILYEYGAQKRRARKLDNGGNFNDKAGKTDYAADLRSGDRFLHRASL